MGDRSVSARDISRAVVVTGDGNTVALDFGDTGITLPLRRKQFPSPDRRRRRARENRRASSTCSSPKPANCHWSAARTFSPSFGPGSTMTRFSVHALIGRAGTGKTRLAIEFCKKIDNDPAGKGEWIAGFVSPADLGPVVEALATHSFAWERPTFLVIDYAAQCHQALARWLDRLADQKLDTKLRILLLDRDAPEAFGWWHDLTVPGPPRRRDLFYDLRPRQLPDLSDLEERRALITAAFEAAHELRPEPRPPRGRSGDRRGDADFDGRLARSSVRQSAQPGHGGPDRPRPRPGKPRWRCAGSMPLASSAVTSCEPPRRLAHSREIRRRHDALHCGV